MSEESESEISLVLIRLEIEEKAKQIDFHFDVDLSFEHLDKGEKPKLPTEENKMPRSNQKRVSDQPKNATVNVNNLEKERKKTDKPLTPDERQKMSRGKRIPGEISIESFDRTEEASTSSTDIPDTEKKPFFSGNPFVEKTQGIMHIYKQNKMTSLKKEDVKRSELLCMLAVPATLTTRDLLKFLNPASHAISQVKIIRDQSPNQYMVLARFRCQTLADEFYASYNGVPYTSLEPEMCHLVYVARVETVKETEGGSMPLEGHTELPTCPVCLERMDESVDGVLTILCNHSFHGSCLSQWGDTSCPVCRYCQTPEMCPEHKCFVCGKQEDLWICLICGYIGCGRYAEAHAYNHFQETSHTFSLQVGTQRVWDYAGDNYVHRLIQSKTDGKVVEFEPANRNANNLESEEKFDSITLEYTCLLTNQLESQRLYFEEKLSKIEKMAQAQIENLEVEVTKAASQCSSIQQQLYKLKQEKTQLEKKLQQANQKLQKCTAEAKEEEDLNNLLRKEQQEWNDRVKALEEKLKLTADTKDKEIQELQEQLRDMMFHFEAQEKLATTEENVEQEDIRDGHLVVGEAPATRRRSRKKK